MSNFEKICQIKSINSWFKQKPIVFHDDLNFSYKYNNFLYLFYSISRSAYVYRYVLSGQHMRVKRSDPPKNEWNGRLAWQKKKPARKTLQMNECEEIRSPENRWENYWMVLRRGWNFW